MDDQDAETTRDFTAAVILNMICSGQLPSNTWAFVRPLAVMGTDQTVIWTVLVSPN